MGNGRVYSVGESSSLAQRSRGTQAGKLTELHDVRGREGRGSAREKSIAATARESERERTDPMQSPAAVGEEHLRSRTTISRDGRASPGR